MKPVGAITLGLIFFSCILGFFFFVRMESPGHSATPAESCGRIIQPQPPENKTAQGPPNHPDMKEFGAASDGDMEVAVSPQENHYLDASLLEKNPAAAYAWLLKHKGVIREEIFDSYQQTILLAWAKKDPATATGQLYQLRPGPARDQLIRGLAIGWATQDISKAFEWLTSVAMRDVSKELVENCCAIIITKYAAVDPIAASRLVERLESKDLQVQLVCPVIENYADLNFNQALAWMWNLENETARNVGMARLINRFGSSDNEEILTAVIKNQDKLTPYTLSTVLEQLAKNIPLKTAEELSHMPAQTQSAVTASFADGWFANDPQAAMSWFAAQPDGPVFEAGAAAIADSITQDNPSAAIAWANSISDPANRFSLISRVVNNTEVERLDLIDQSLNELSISLQERDLLRSVIKQRLATIVEP